jgi:hypothetical protein
METTKRKEHNQTLQKKKKKKKKEKENEKEKTLCPTSMHDLVFSCVVLCCVFWFLLSLSH